MALPPNAKQMPQPMDPTDVLDWSATLVQGLDTDNPVPILRSDESVASFTLLPRAEAIAAGLTILQGNYNGKTYPPPTITGLLLTFWLNIAAGSQASATFDSPGLTLGIELTITTTNDPPRIKQRTLTVTVANQ